MFAEACQKVGLNGVEHPFWADFAGLDICQVIPPDVLHGLHKAFKDHHITWLTNLIGKDDMDARFMHQPKIIGFCHFSLGLSCLSQFSGKEHRDMQQYILAAVADHQNVPCDTIKAIRAELDFIFTAQYISHTDLTISELGEYNACFHRYKDISFKQEHDVERMAHSITSTYPKYTPDTITLNSFDVLARPPILQLKDQKDITRKSPSFLFQW